jgi:cell division protein FtsZ
VRNHKDLPVITNNLFPKKARVSNRKKLLSFINWVLLREGLINIDYADLKTIFNDARQIDYGSGLSWSKKTDGMSRGDRVGAAVIKHLGGGKDKYRAVLFNVAGGKDLSLHDVNDAAMRVYSACSRRVHIIFGAVIDKKYQGKIRIDVVGAR